MTLAGIPAAALEPSYSVSDAYAAGPYYTALQSVDLTGDQRTDLINVALSQVGYHEGNSVDDLGGTSTGGSNFTEYGSWYGLNGRIAAWCAMFISWCARQAGIPTSVLSNSTYARSDDFSCTWHELAAEKAAGLSYTPRAGDLIIFVRNGGSLYPTNVYGGSHVGIVTRVSGGRVYTVEGNAGSYTNQVIQTSYSLSYSRILGYAVPNYTTDGSVGSSNPLRISLTQYPTTLTQGSSFGLDGTISSGQRITRVNGAILSASGAAVQTTTDYPNATAILIKNADLNNSMLFSKLAAGSYTLRVTATDASGKSTTVKKPFTVQAAAVQAPADPDDSTLAVSLTGYPVSLTAGSSFNLQGTVSSNCAITRVSGAILNAAGTTLQTTTDTPNAASLSIQSANLNKKLLFSKLAAGSYTLKVTATDASGNTVSSSKAFTVGSTSGSKTSPAPSNSALAVNLTGYPVSLTPGGSFNLQGTVSSNCAITRVNGTILNASGVTLQTTTDTPNATSLNIQSANLNKKLLFSKLAAGSYTLKITALDASGDTATVTKAFTVGSASGSKTPAAQSNSALAVNLTGYPVNLTPGGSFNLQGTVSSNCAITRVNGTILNASGVTLQTTTDTPNAASLSIQSANLNKKLMFGKLAAGKYTLRVTATDASGKSVTVTKAFTVGSASGSKATIVQTSAKSASALAVNLTGYPVNLTAGGSFNLQGTVSSNYTITRVNGTILNASGVTLQTTTDTPNAVSLNIQSANLNKKLMFGKLAAGKYTLRVTATDASGKSVKITKAFTVK
jgi:hypothetical protein